MKDSESNSLAERLKELARRATVTGYRAIAKARGCAPSASTTDEDILRIYSEVGQAFRAVAERRGEILRAGNLNTIVLKFLQVWEQFEREMYAAHLEYEVERYETSGLREDYKRELDLIVEAEAGVTSARPEGAEAGRRADSAQPSRDLRAAISTRVTNLRSLVPRRSIFPIGAAAIVLVSVAFPTWTLKTSRVEALRLGYGTILGPFQSSVEPLVDSCARIQGAVTELEEKENTRTVSITHLEEEQDRRLLAQEEHKRLHPDDDTIDIGGALYWSRSPQDIVDSEIATLRGKVKGLRADCSTQIQRAQIDYGRVAFQVIGLLTVWLAIAWAIRRRDGRE